MYRMANIVRISCKKVSLGVVHLMAIFARDSLDSVLQNIFHLKISKIPRQCHMQNSLEMYTPTLKNLPVAF